MSSAKRAGAIAAPSAATRFLAARLEARNENGLWLALSLLLGIVAAARFLVQADEAPGGIQSDAMMFLSWMGRWDDPAALGGDLVADYWRSVTPWFFRFVFEGAWWLGLGPHVVARLLPAILFVAVPFFSFRFLRAIGAEPLVACAATALALFNFVAVTGSMASATPRSLWPLLLLALLDGLARRSVWQSALAQGCLAGSYPQLTLVTATTIGLTLLKPGFPFLDLGRRQLLLVGVCAAATVAGILPFLLDTGAFGPVVTLAEARNIPTFGPAGRNSVFEADGSIDLLCDGRLGLFPKACRGSPNLVVLCLVLAVAAGPLVLFLRWLRVEGEAKPRMRSALPFFLVLASLAWFALAASQMFRLHLPSRYATALIPLAILTTFPLLVERIRDRPFPRWLVTRRDGRAVMHGGTLAALALAFAGALAVRPVMHEPREPALLAFVRTLPRDAVVAGFVEDLDFSPVLTDRSTLFNRELTIGYQLGYLRPVMARMADLRDAILTADPAVLAERLGRNRVGVLFVAEDTLAVPRVPEPFRGFFRRDALEEAEARAAGVPSALARLAPLCALTRFGAVLALDAACLAKQAETPAGRAGASGL